MYIKNIPHLQINFVYARIVCKILMMVSPLFYTMWRKYYFRRHFRIWVIGGNIRVGAPCFVLCAFVNDYILIETVLTAHFDKIFWVGTNIRYA